MVGAKIIWTKSYSEAANGWWEKKSEEIGNHILMLQNMVGGKKYLKCEKSGRGLGEGKKRVLFFLSVAENGVQEVGAVENLAKIGVSGSWCGRKNFFF
jgi:hypothetical protein